MGRRTCQAFSLFFRTESASTWLLSPKTPTLCPHVLPCGMGTSLL
ncbi:hypothetical protein Taro_004125, partial [Colocasia esculenta]|nr:hypothetical protein [Colocasia esculenta]